MPKYSSLNPELDIAPPSATARMFPALWAAFADDPEACAALRKGLEFETAMAADKARATAGRDAARAIIMGDHSARNEVLRDERPSFIDHAELWRCYAIDEAAMLSRRPANRETLEGEDRRCLTE